MFFKGNFFACLDYVEDALYLSFNFSYLWECNHKKEISWGAEHIHFWVQYTKKHKGEQTFISNNFKTFLRLIIN